MKRIIGLKPTERQNCTNCKYSNSILSTTTSIYNKINTSYTCKISKKSVNKDKCFCYIKRGSFLDKLTNHLSKHWKYWIGIIITISLGIISIVFSK